MKINKYIIPIILNKLFLEKNKFNIKKLLFKIKKYIKRKKQNFRL